MAPVLKLLMKRLFLVLIFVTNYLVGMTNPVDEFILSPTDEIKIAKVFFSKTSNNVKALLILAPGQNSSGMKILARPKWQEFAKKHSLILCSYHFASDDNFLRQGKGYFRAERESGRMLLEQIDTYFDGKSPPLLLHGVSGGAHFGSSLVDLVPDRFIFWSAYSAAWWISPAKHEFYPPGVVACGTHDALRFYPSLSFFQEGRRLGYQWTWVALKDMGHAINEDYEDFIMQYMATLLNGSVDDSGILSDIHLRSEINLVPNLLSARKDEHFSWIPNSRLKSIWDEIHEF